MTALEQIQLLMNEIGPNTPEIEAIVQKDDAIWSIGFENHTIVTIEYRTETPGLILTASIGQPAPEKQIEVYQTLLAYNSLWKKQKGLVVTVIGEESNLAFQYGLEAANLTLPSLRTVLLNFSNLAEEWHRYVTGDSTLEAPEAAADTLDTLHLLV